MESTIQRITEYEKLLCEAEEILRNYVPERYEELRSKIESLEGYYASEEWRKDYEADEAGLLPHDLKRGVLSEDGIYNVLERFHELEREQSTDNESMQRRSQMKVLIINGSPRVDGNTTVGVNEMVKVFGEEGIEAEVIRIGNKDVRGCVACGSCAEKGKCVFDDVVNEIAAKFEEADGLVIASPVYYASANGTLISCLDRLFYSSHFDKTMKVGASVAVARRGGCSATYDELNKYFTISGMPVASSQYWNSLHGREKGDAEQDLEGLQTLRVLAKNMSFLIKSIALGKEKYGLPEKEEHQWTHFIR